MTERRCFSPSKERDSTPLLDEDEISDISMETITNNVGIVLQTNKEAEQRKSILGNKK